MGTKPARRHALEHYLRSNSRIQGVIGVPVATSITNQSKLSVSPLIISIPSELNIAPPIIALTSLWVGLRVLGITAFAVLDNRLHLHRGLVRRGGEGVRHPAEIPLRVILLKDIEDRLHAVDLVLRELAVEDLLTDMLEEDRAVDGCHHRRTHIP